MDCIYFDNAATTRPFPEVLEAFTQTAMDTYANPSALHSIGFGAEKAIRDAASHIARALQVKRDEIYFTSGGTESNNLAITGASMARRRTHKHMITQITEHPAVMEVYRTLESEGFSVTWLKTNRAGHISVQQISESLQDDTGLVSVMHVNNETGAVQDIEAIGGLLKLNSSAYFFVDGIQGFGKIPLKLKNVDMYSFSGHKIHCVKGVGGLYVKQNVRLIPQILGGGQQRNMRSGTENTSGIAALAEATKLAYGKIEENAAIASALKAGLIKGLTNIEGVSINGGEGKCSPYIVNAGFTGVRGEVLLHALAADGLFVSTGSACSSNKKGASNNIIANMGYGKEVYESSLRFSFSHKNTMEEVEKALEMIERHVIKLRKYTRK